MELKIDIVDAFTSERFKGNPAAVVILDDWLDATLMQSIATENNLSETAFAVPDSSGRFHIRWFSPLTEIEFCGHASLATSYVLFQRHPSLIQLKFFAEAVGEFSVKRFEDGLLSMSFPERSPRVVESVPDALVQGLGHVPHEVLRSEQAYFVIYQSEEEIMRIAPDFERLKALAPFDVVITAPGDKYDFVSRYFWPANGGDEDPVTGSIHAGLAPMWAKKLGKTQLKAYQASQRGGVIYCQVEGDKVVVSGEAVPYLNGTIIV